MSDIVLVNRTQRIIVDVPTKTVSMIISGPAGPPGPPGEVTDAELASGLATRVAKTGDVMTGALTIPANTASGQAARVSAYNATTGQLAIGGVELGNTGWRNVGTLLVNGWTATNIWLRRCGATCSMHFVPLKSQTATADKFMSTISGFNVLNGIGHIALGQPGVAGAMFVSVSGEWRISPRGSTDHYSVLTWTTSDAWPTTLPGTQHTAPFTG